MKKGEEVSRIGAVVEGVLARAATQRRALAGIQRRWSGLVGRTLAAHTKPTSLRKGQLIVYADRPGDAFALSYQRTQLLERLQAAGGGRIEDIIIRPGDVKRV